MNIQNFDYVDFLEGISNRRVISQLLEFPKITLKKQLDMTVKQVQKLNKDFQLKIEFIGNEKQNHSAHYCPLKKVYKDEEQLIKINQDVQTQIYMELNGLRIEFIGNEKQNHSAHYCPLKKVYKDDEQLIKINQDVQTQIYMELNRLRDEIRFQQTQKIFSPFKEIFMKQL